MHRTPRCLQDEPALVQSDPASLALRLRHQAGGSGGAGGASDAAPPLGWVADPSHEAQRLDAWVEQVEALHQVGCNCFMLTDRDDELMLAAVCMHMLVHCSVASCLPAGRNQMSKLPGPLQRVHTPCRRTPRRRRWRPPCRTWRRSCRCLCLPAWGCGSYPAWGCGMRSAVHKKCDVTGYAKHEKGGVGLVANLRRPQACCRRGRPRCRRILRAARCPTRARWVRSCWRGGLRTALPVFFWTAALCLAFVLVSPDPPCFS